MENNNFFKICYFNDENIDKIYVFIGNFPNFDTINNLFNSNPTDPIFYKFFDLQELNFIIQNKIELIFISKQIYIDDSIETIKKKYILATKNDEITLPSIYFFNKTNVHLSSKQVFEQLTQNGKFEITSTRLIQFLLNINDLDVSQLPQKEIYDYNDILALNLDQREFWTIDEPLGIEYLANEKNYIITANPFKALQYDDFLISHSSDIISTLNQNLLLQTRNIFKNQIYVVHFPEVISYLKSSSSYLLPSSLT